MTYKSDIFVEFIYLQQQKAVNAQFASVTKQMPTMIKMLKIINNLSRPAC